MLCHHREIREAMVFYYSYDGIELSPSVATFTRLTSLADGFRFVAYTPSDAARLEDQIREGAQGLKNVLVTLAGSSEPTTWVEDV